MLALIAVEQRLWALISADERVMAALQQWRWLHGWGPWTWGDRRVQWQASMRRLLALAPLVDDDAAVEEEAEASAEAPVVAPVVAPAEAPVEPVEAAAEAAADGRGGRASRNVLGARSPRGPP